MATSAAEVAVTSAGSPARWQRALAGAVRDTAELAALLHLDPQAVAKATGFPLLVPRGFVARMRAGDPHDPLLRQVLPTAAETADVAGFSADPVGEWAAVTVPGLVRKYRGRALVLLASGCAVNCRYCFRREFPYAASGATRRGVAAGVDAIAADETISEVILSGGDPLLLDDTFLADLVGRLERIPHVRRLRIHTRLPVVLPPTIRPSSTSRWPPPSRRSPRPPP